MEVIRASAGLDAHRRDLAPLGLISRCYSEIGRRISDQEKGPFGVLEAGMVVMLIETAFPAVTWRMRTV